MDIPANERYVFKPFPGSSHSWALDQLSTANQNHSVLDVGPGSAGIGKWLKSRGLAELYAVEPDLRTHEQLNQIYRQVEATLDPYMRQSFDIILLLDVLEHMAIPTDFLIKVTRLLKSGGTLLISVPNIAHWSTRLALLLGYFPYTERGLLDRTHLQFFTKARLRQEIAAAHLELLEAAGSISPAELVLPQWIHPTLAFRFFSNLRKFGVLLHPGLCAYQHLARCTRKRC